MKHHRGRPPPAGTLARRRWDRVEGSKRREARAITRAFAPWLAAALDGERSLTDRERLWREMIAVGAVPDGPPPEL